MMENEQEENTLDTLNTYVYPATALIELDKSFKDRLQEGDVYDLR